MSVVMDRGVTNPGRARQRITVDEYYRMAEEGLLPPNARTELIDGEIITMPPIGMEHSGTSNYVLERFITTLLGRAIVSPSLTLCLDDYSAPEPDACVLKYREDYYRRKRAAPADVLLVAEVSHSSLNNDRKIKAPLYARTGIPEYWIFDVQACQLEIYRRPLNGTYSKIAVVDQGDALSIELLPDVKIDLSDFFESDDS